MADVPDKPSVLDVRLRKLEDNYTSLLSILQRIEKRLIGDIEKDSTGLIYEVKILRDQQLANVAEIAKSETQARMFEKRMQVYDDAVKDIDKFQIVMEDFTKKKWMFVGAVAVIGVFVGKIEWLWQLISPP